MNWLAWANRRQSATSAANLSAPSRVLPRSAASRATCQPNGGRPHQPTRSASTASKAWLRTSTTAR